MGCGFGSGAALPPNPHHRLRINPVQETWEGDRLADMMRAGDPGGGPLDAHAEAAVRHRAIAPQVEVPLIVVHVEAVLADAALQQLGVVDALRAADDLAVAL